jgi:polyisoprenoid-binding protein YceI
MRFLASLVLAAAATVGAMGAELKLTGDNTKIEFTGTKPQGKHDGGFKKLTGTVTADAADLTKTKIDVTIDMDSLYSDNAMLTAHLKNPDFFDTKTVPTSKFVSTKVEKDGDKYKVTGKLTMNNKEKEISFPAKITTDGGVFKLESEFKIKRLDFEVGTKFPDEKLANDVAMRVKVEVK